MSTHEDRWLEAKLAEGEQRKQAMKEEAIRIRQWIRQGLRITPETHKDFDYSPEGRAWIDPYDGEKD